MTTRLSKLFVLLLLTSCNNKTDETRQKVADDINSEVFHIDHQSLDSASNVHETFLVTLENLYNLSDKNFSRAMQQADSLLFNCDTNYRRTRHSINENMMKDLHFFKGELFFRSGAYSKALREFAYDTIVDFNIGRAACLLKLKKESEAFQNIENSKGYCYSGFVLGNYYEILGKPDSALSIYKREIDKDWIKDTRLRDVILTRINELNRKKTSKLLNLYIPTRLPSRPMDNCN